MDGEGTNRATRSRPRLGLSESVLVAATLVGALLILVGLGRESLWVDEAHSVNVTSGPLRDLAEWLAFEMNMAAYYVALLPVVAISTSELVVRLPSALAGIACIPLLFTLVRTTVGERAAAFSVVLLVANPFFIEYGREARSYAMLLAATLAATLAFVHALRTGERRWWVLWTVTAASCTYFHYFGLLVPVAHVGAALACRRLDLRASRVRASLLNLGVLVSPQVILVALQNPAGTWIPPLSVQRVVDQLGDLAGGSALALAVSAVTIALLWLWIARARGRISGERLLAATLFTALLLIPVAVAVGASVVRPMLVSRYLTAALAGLLPLLAMALSLLRPRAAGVALAAMLVVVTGSGVVGIHREPQKPDWRGASTLLVEHVTPDDTVLIVPHYASWPVEYYETRLTGERDERRVTGLTLEGFLGGRDLAPIDFCEPAGSTSVWVVVSSRDRSDFAESGLSYGAWRPLLEQGPTAAFHAVDVHRYLTSELCRPAS